MKIRHTMYWTTAKQLVITGQIKKLKFAVSMFTQIPNRNLIP